jgi:hypothetical protein
MKVQSSLLIALLMIPLLGITGCATTKTVKVLSEPVNSVALNPPNIRELELQGIKWFIVTPENIDEVFKKLEDQNKDVVLFGITDDGYKGLALNLAQIRELLLQQKAIIEAYKEYYEETEQRINKQKDDYNKKLNNSKESSSGFLDFFRR